MIKVKLPDRYQLSPELLNEFAVLNADLKISANKGNKLVIKEDAYRFEDVEMVELLFPASVFEDDNFDELYDINPDNGYRLNFEQSGYHSILFKMGTFALISALTAIITASLVIWAKKNKSGRVFSENGEYHLNKKIKAHRKGGVHMADISYISFDKAGEKEQEEWTTRIPIAPTLSIEIVSAKKALKQTLNKMRTVWMAYGTEIGVVIDPFSKKYFVFEKDKASYKEYSIYKTFTHRLLPGYEGDFSQYVDEIK